MIKKAFFFLVILSILLLVSKYALDFTYGVLKGEVDRQVARHDDINRLSPTSIKKLNYVVDGSGPYKNYVQIDPELGWSIKSNGESRGLYTSNSTGIRSKREYAVTKPEDVRLRVAAFGDSFTHSDDVADEFTWENFIELKDPSLEVMNFGVGGYGTDQAWIRYQIKGKQFKPDIVLIGIMTENINRNVNYFVPFYRRLSSPVTKPRFIINKNDELELLPNKLRTYEDYVSFKKTPEKYLREFGKNDYFYKRELQSKYNNKYTRLFKYIYINLTDPWMLNSKGQYNVHSEPYKVTLSILENFYNEVKAEGSKPLIVIFPEASDVQNAASGLPRRHQPMIDELEKRDLKFIDVLDGFIQRKELNIGKLFKGHYSPHGNEIVADIILESVNNL